MRLLWIKVPFHGSDMTVRVETAVPLTRAHIERAQHYLQLAADDLDPEPTTEE